MTEDQVIHYLSLIIEGLLAVISGGIGWAYKELKHKLEAQAKEFADYKVHIAENYVTQPELTKAFDTLSRSIEAVFAKLERIEDKLDNKQDKST